MAAEATYDPAWQTDPAALMAPAQGLGFDRARSTSGEAVVARRAAARAEGMEPPPDPEDPDQRVI